MEERIVHVARSPMPSSPLQVPPMRMARIATRIPVIHPLIAYYPVLNALAMGVQRIILG